MLIMQPLVAVMDDKFSPHQCSCTFSSIVVTLSLIYRDQIIVGTWMATINYPTLVCAFMAV